MPHLLITTPTTSRPTQKFNPRSAPGSGEEQWLKISVQNSIVVLSALDKAILLNGSYLNDKHIDAAQLLLLQQFQKTEGLYSSLQLSKIVACKKITYGLQIIHDRTNHWIVASNYNRNDNIIEVYDSVFQTVNAKTRSLIGNLFQPCPGKKPTLQIVKKQKQVGGQDCGLFAIATAIAILSGHNAESIYFNQKSMREHLARCLQEQYLTPFPEEII